MRNTLMIRFVDGTKRMMHYEGFTTYEKLVQDVKTYAKQHGWVAVRTVLVEIPKV